MNVMRTAAYQKDKPVDLHTVILDHFKAVFFRQNLETNCKKEEK